MRLSLFDLDNTLLSGDSDFSWGQFLVDQGALDRELYEAKNQQFYEQYKAGVLDIHEFLNFQLKPLARHSRAQLTAWHAQFMSTVIQPMISPLSRQLLAERRAAGDLIAIVTATNSFVTGPIALALGVEHLVATEPEEVDGVFTGKVAGTPCFREHKLTRVNQWLAGRGQTLADFPDSWFYSDSLNDLPLLSAVAHPVAVDPDEVLRAHAEQHGWPILTLRVSG